MKNSVYGILIFQVLIGITSCSKEDNDPKTEVKIESDKIICEMCDDFGVVLEANTNQVFVGGRKRVWIFDYSLQGNKLVQEIDFSNEGWLTNILVNEGSLYLGINDNEGTGSVHQYLENNSEWKYKTRYDIGRSEDNFGDDIAVTDNVMVIGASALWDESFSQANSDPGSFYIYTKEGVDWKLNKEFYAQDSQADDWFGNDVVIWNDLILVGGLSIPLHMYGLGDNGWELSWVEAEILPLDLASSEDTFLYITDSDGLQSFKINTDGTITSIDVNANLDLFNLGYSNDNISMHKNYALISTFNEAQKAYLLKLENGVWVLDRTFSIEEVSGAQYYGIKLTEDFAILSGYSEGKSFLNFEEY